MAGSNPPPGFTTSNLSRSNPARDEKRHCLHASAFKKKNIKRRGRGWGWRVVGGGWVWRSVGGAQIRSSKSSRMQMRQLNGVNRRASADWRHARLSSQVLRLEGRWGRGGGGEVAGAVSIPCRAPPLSLRLHEGQLPRLATPLPPPVHCVGMRVSGC